jgi:hypothetical protein
VVPVVLAWAVNAIVIGEVVEFVRLLKAGMEFVLPLVVVKFPSPTGNGVGVDQTKLTFGVAELKSIACVLEPLHMVWEGIENKTFGEGKIVIA